MDIRQFLRLSKWARRPPSRRQRWIVGTVLALCLVLAGIEWAFGWPDALTVNRLR